MKELIDILQLLLLLALLYFVVRQQNPFIRKTSKNKLILDTCALIDGRIVEIATAGFMPVQLVVPRFVVEELQLLADGQDAHKRERARFGLDMVQALQNDPVVDVVIHRDNADASLATDDRLVMLAKRLSADLCTIDYNLNKVATIEGVRVLNVNELANAVRPVALPGERKRIKIVQKGSNKDQGVGYLEDGSMVVVADASRSIGKTIEVEVSRYIQTDAGKMLFAQAVKPNHGNRSSKR